MDWIHCNKCFVNFNVERRICFSSCGHLMCFDCLKVEQECVRSSVCIICQRTNIKLINVDQQMKPELKQLFRTPYDLYTEFSEKLKKVVEFQQNNRLRLKERQTLEKLQNAARQMLKMEQKKSEEYVRMAQKELAQLKAEMERYKDQAQLLETKLADRDKQIRHHVCKLQLQAKNACRSLPSLNGNTPLMGLSFSECAMSTPINASTVLQIGQEAFGNMLATPILNESEITGRVRMPDTPAMLRGRKTHETRFF